MKRCLLSALAVGLSLAANVMAQVPSYVPTNGLVGWWPFNGNANDESGNGLDGTIISGENGLSFSTDRFNNSTQSLLFNSDPSFNNSNAPFVSVSNSSNSINSNYSITFWSKISLNNSVGEIINKGSDASSFFLSRFQGLNSIAFGNLPTYINFNTAIDTTWHMYSFVFDINEIGSLFIDGNLIYSQVISAPLSNSNNLSFGKMPSGGSNGSYYPYQGKLDDIGIWNRALTQQEITNLYNGCSASTITSQPTNQTVNPTTSAQFVVNATSGSSFQWQTDLGFGFQNLSNAGQYSGANNDTLVVSNATVSNNNQQFRCIINSASCADTSDIAVLSVSTVGINELSVQGNVSLYPNPTQSSFEIQTNLVYSKIEIRDMQGRIVKTENAAKTINLSSLQKGTYSVNLLDEQENTLAVRKIVLQ